MEKEEAFTINKNTGLFLDGNYVLFNDSSLMYSIPAYGSFQLLLGDGYHMSLGINGETGECLTFYTLLDAITLEPSPFELLNVSNIPRASLFFYSDSLKRQEGDHYTPFVEKKYYDEKNRILAFGDINSKGDLIEFSNNTYALIDDCRLAAVYIRVSINVIDAIKKKTKKKLFRFWHK